jgi:hypothetical protein
MKISVTYLTKNYINLWLTWLILTKQKSLIMKSNLNLKEGNDEAFDIAERD